MSGARLTGPQVLRASRSDPYDAGVRLTPRRSPVSRANLVFVRAAETGA
jgi:hypothetical protein